MKKSQVVASVAAASVLGVALPVMNTAYALEWGDGTAVKASCDEVKNAYTYVSNQAAYKWFAERAAIDAKTVADAKGNIAYPDFTAGNASDLYTKLIAGFTFAAGVTPTPDGSTNPSAADFERYNASVAGIKLQSTDFEIKNADNTTTNIAADSINGVKKLTAAVEKGDATVKAFMALSDAIKGYDEAAADKKDAAAQTLSSAVISFKAQFSTITAVNSWKTNVTDVVTDVTEAVVDGIFGTGTVAFFNAINDNYNVLRAELPKVEAGVAAYRGLLNNGILKDAGKTALAAVTDNTAGPVNALKGIAADNNANTIYGTNWGTLYGTVSSALANAAQPAPATVPLCVEGDASTTNGTKVKNLATDYKGATDVDKTLEDIAMIMTGYTVTPEQPGEGDNKPGDNKPGEGENKPGAGDNKPAGPTTADKNNSSAAGTIGGVNKNGTPNTGVAMATAEGATAKSAGIVSTLISAIAAAGAGLTVLRRNKKNA